MTSPVARDPRRPVTQEDVARAVGVSRTLVSFAFRGAPGVSSETRQAILEAPARLGYRQNTAAADLASYDSRLAGLTGIDLTSVDLGAPELGRAAGAAALDRLARPNAPIVDTKSEPRLVIRASIARR